MKRNSLLSIVSILLILSTTNCNTGKHNSKKRTTASVESPEAFDQRFDDAFAQALTEKFNGSNLINKVSSTDPNSNPLSAMMIQNGIKEALSVEFDIADEYQSVSDKTYKECVENRKEDPDFECTNIMDTDVYKRSMAVWMYSDYVKAQAKRSYQRLVEIGENTDSDLVNKISLRTGSGSSQVSGFAKSFRKNFTENLKKNVEGGFAHVSSKTGGSEFRRGAMGTLDYAAQAELASIINEINDDEEESQSAIDVNLESLYRINRESYKSEAKSGEAKPEELEAFENVINLLSPTKQQRKIANIGWQDVHGDTFKMGEYALTYDDGPKSTTTNKLIDYLASGSVERALGYKPHVTFFVQARSAGYKSNRDVVEKVRRSGHSIGSHSYSHEDFMYFIRGGQLSWSSQNKSGERISLKEQLIDAKSIIENIYNTNINYFRLPYASGRQTRAIQRVIADTNLVHVFWNVNADDWRWRSVSPASITQNYIREIEKEGRGVLLLHDIHEYTVGTLTPALIDYFAANRNRIKIVPLEKGIQETFINVSANGRLPSNLVRMAAAPRQNRSVVESSFPHVRQITISTLNVRTGPSASAPKCGEYSANDQVLILGQNGWFQIDMNRTPARAPSGYSRHACGSVGYISSGSGYSRKMN